MSQSLTEEPIPPWEQFPTIERYSIGWRMGCGEQYIGDWSGFFNSLPSDFDTRLAYFKRHRPAPLNWADWVANCLGLGEEREDANAELIPQLKQYGVIEADAAYVTWLAQQSSLAWPWLGPLDDTPEEFARYCTREFWFFSRQLNSRRQAGDVVFPELPTEWEPLRVQLHDAEIGNVDPKMGLQSLAQMLCAGIVLPPWTLGLTVDDFEDSFEMGMGYVDAFRLWMISGFDDDALLWEMLMHYGIPKDWKEWVSQRAVFGLETRR